MVANEWFNLPFDFTLNVLISILTFFFRNLKRDSFLNSQFKIHYTKLNIDSFLRGNTCLKKAKYIGTVYWLNLLNKKNTLRAWSI